MDEKKKSSGQPTGGKESVCENLSFAAKEAFKRLRTNVVMSFPEGDTSCHIIGVTSSQPHDGKSTIATNLAYSLAELGKKILLIDADMRRPTVHEKLGVEKHPGLSDLTRDYNSINDALKPYKSAGGVTFDVLPGGDAIQNPSELLNSKRMSTLLETLSTAYDYIVVDLPPIGAVIDAVSISRSIDGMIVVVRENTCPRGLLNECMLQLKYVNVNILGFVVNGALEGSSKKYQYGAYGSYGSYGYYGSY